jgi:hypothetical protein
MDVLGHSQIAITMDLYAHVMPASREAADAIDRVLGQGERWPVAVSVAVN